MDRRTLTVLCSVLFICLGGLAFVGPSIGQPVEAATPTSADQPVAALTPASSADKEAPGGSQSSFAATEAAENGSLSTDSLDADADEQRSVVSERGPTIELDQELRRVTDRPGIFEARHTYSIPDEAGLLEVTLPEGAEVRSTRGFRQHDARTYEWDGTTAQPRLRYQLEGNQSIDQTGPIAGPGRFIFVDVGEWALVSRPSVSHRWGWVGPDRVGFESEMRAAEGVTGEVMAYLGEYELFTHQAHGQEFKLVVPERADLVEDRTELFASLSDAADRLRVGDPDEEVFMVAAPTRNIDWGVRGLQGGPADMWVRDFERLADPDNVWLHEYVHTRQDYAAASDIEWFTEGSATYYAAWLTLQQDRISFSEFRDRMARGTGSFSGSILAEPGTWRSNANYPIGALVSGELDRQIRLASDGEQSFDEVFRQLNAHDGVVTADVFQRALVRAGDEAVAEAGERFTRTTERPGMWTEQQHADAFDAVTPARITFAPGDEVDRFQATGQYRNRTLGADTPVVLVPGETLTLSVVATNDGGQAGEYRAPLTVNGEEQSVREGRLDASSSTTLQFEHRFDTVGEYSLSVGTVDVPVSVRAPARARVTSLSAEPTETEVGETVTVSITVENTADYPGELTIPVTRNGDEVASQTVRLDATEQRTVTVDQQLDEAGTVVFGLGDAGPDTVIVMVTESAAEPADDDGPGFGFLAAIVALAGVGLWARRL